MSEARTEQAERGGRPTIAAWLVFAAILAVAAWWRVDDLGAFRNGPDDGSYLHSARIHQLERGLDFWNWPAEDLAWIRELFANYGDEINTYQHSYLHQWTTRVLWRAGFGAVESLRLSSVLTSLVGVWFAWLLARRLWPGRAWTALLAALLVAFHPLLVFYGRAGWGQAGFTAFYLGFLAVAWRLVGDPRPLSRRCAAWCALALAATSLLAFGWQENVAPWIVASSLVVFGMRVLAPAEDDAQGVLARLRSRRTVAYVLGCAPVGAATLALFLWSPFAQKYWFDPAGRARLPWFELKEKTLADLFVEQRAIALLGWILLAAALVGVRAAWRQSRRACLWLVATALLGSATLFLLFGDAWLLRAHLPAFAIACLLAARGAAALPRALALVAAALLAGWCLSATRASLHQGLDHPFFLRTLYQRASEEPKDQRHVDDALYATLVERRAEGEVVGAAFDKVPMFRLLDLGLRSVEIAPSGDMPREAAPRWIVGVASLMKARRCLVEDGGPYELVALDGVGRHGLYRLADGR
ncbi:MAG: Dolichyl-phosphate-mannose-protein mannosyltransferase [Planctomycetota bacterium]